MYQTIVSVDQLRELVAAGGALLIDCEFDLGNPDRGKAIHTAGHLPGARYLDLQRDLSGFATGTNGRHPLPGRDEFAATMRRLGLDAGQQVIAYDGNGGIYAARLWWMLRWLGHAPVAVLDGGKQEWVAAGLPLETGDAAPVMEGNFRAGPSLVGEPAGIEEIVLASETGALQVIDARDAARFGGAPHPLDTASGHIPGAVNRFYRDNFDAQGRFRPAAELAAEFRQVLGPTPPSQAVHQCGSGVTACHNVLAMEIAGITGSRLYPGSWSEWTADPSRPIAV